MRIVGYARVSKEDVKRNPNALAQQVDRLKSDGCSEVFQETASSTKGKRPIFARVLTLVENQEVDRVVVTRIDRLGRTRELSAVFQLFINAKVNLRVIDQKIDLESSAGRLVANVLADMAIFEGDLIGERSKHGWEYLRKRQEAMNPPFGYKKSTEQQDITLPDGRVVKTRRHELDHRGFLCMLPTKQRPDGSLEIISAIDWTEETQEQWAKNNTLSRADAARDLIDTYLITKSIRKTIRTFNLKYGLLKFSNSRVTHSGFEDEGIFQRSTSSFASWITNPVLRGHLRYFLESTADYRKRNKDVDPEERDDRKEKVFCGTHLDQQLITEEEFRQIQTIIKQNRESHGFKANEKLKPLSGLITCAVCGVNYYSSDSKEQGRKPRDYYYFYCGKANLATCESAIEGKAKYLNRNQVEERILNAVKDDALQFQEKAHKPIEEKENPEILKKQHEIQQLQQLTHISGIAQTIETLQAEIEILRGESKHQEIEPEHKAKILSALRDDRFWQGLTDDQKYFIYRDLIDRIEVKPCEVQPMAWTNNEWKPRKKAVDWDINVILKGKLVDGRVTWNNQPSKALIDAVELFLVTHPDVEPIIVRPLSEFADFMLGLANGTQKLD